MLEIRTDLPEVWGGGTTGVERVDVRILDEFVPQWGRYALKVDAQGFDGEVVEGGTEFLGGASVVEMELSPREVYKDQMLMLDIMQAMESFGLTLAAIGHAYTLPTGQSLQFNGIFVRQERLSRG